MERHQEQRNNAGESADIRGATPVPAAANDPVLRRLVGRLCLAGLGRTPELDAQLKHISQLARTGQNVAEFQSALEPLTRAVTALDETSLTTTSTAITPADEDLRKQLEREKAEIEALLHQLDSHLETLASFLAHEEAQSISTHDDTNQLNILVLDEVREISAEISGDCSLADLRQRVGNRLNTINSHINDFRVRAENRKTEQINRVRALKVRVDQLERESRSLQHSLREEQRLALVDTLTNIPNRAAWDERISREYARWLRQGGMISLAIWDVDHFKSINDEYGHKTGDKILRVLAQYLARELRPSDFVARYGGEEFVMLFLESSAEDALKIANRIRTKVPDIAFQFHESRVAVSLSCGITTFRLGDTADGIFERADRALYAAKDAGRNRCVVR